MANENGSGPTWKIIAKVAAIIIFGMVSWFTANTHSRVADLEKSKVDKEQYYRDVGDIKNGINSLMEMHLEDKGKRK